VNDQEQLIRTEILPCLESFANNLWDSGSNAEGQKLDRIIDKLRNVLNDTHFTPKVAHIEVNLPSEEFLEGWHSENDDPPTQEDYDNWVRSYAWGFVDAHIHELDNLIKLRRINE
jgi:hypothetical protein